MADHTHGADRPDAAGGGEGGSLRRSVFNVIDSSTPGDWKSHWFDGLMMALILINVTAVILETVEELSQEFHGFFYAFEIFSVAVFSVEYVLRVWACVEEPEAVPSHPLKRRLKFMGTPLALIDAIAILPFYLSFFLTVDLRFMRIFRLLRLLKLTRYSPALATFAAVLHSQRRSLGAALMIMLTLLIFAASIAYLFEKEAQPEAFASIPHAMWWALATLTTVGYGDVTPVTLGGQLFGGLVMILGIGMFAVPTGILATGFANEIRKRDFVVTWQLVAGVPLFSKLDAARIASVVELLTPQLVPPRYTIVKRGESADSMYIVAIGEVEVDVQPLPQRLGPGEFFGEIALLKESKRTATVTTVTECQLLVLGVGEFRRLVLDYPELHDSLTQIMEERLSEIEQSGAEHP